MSNGEYTSNLDDLDIIVPSETKYTYNCSSTECQARPKDSSLPIIQFNHNHINSEDPTEQPSNKMCVARKDTQAEEICKNMSTSLVSRGAKWGYYSIDL